MNPRNTLKLSLGIMVMMFTNMYSGEANAVQLNLAFDRVVVLNDSFSTSIPIQVSYDGINWSSSEYIHPGEMVYFATLTPDRTNPENKILFRYVHDYQGQWSKTYTVYGGDAIRLKPNGFLSANKILIDKIASLRDQTERLAADLDKQRCALEEKRAALGISPPPLQKQGSCEK